jgi:hypothetical protein
MKRVTGALIVLTEPAYSCEKLVPNYCKYCKQDDNFTPVCSLLPHFKTLWSPVLKLDRNGLTVDKNKFKSVPVDNNNFTIVPVNAKKF